MIEPVFVPCFIHFSPCETTGIRYYFNFDMKMTITSTTITTFLS